MSESTIDWGEYVPSTIESADLWKGPNGEIGDYCSPDGFQPMRYVGKRKPIDDGSVTTRKAGES